LFPASKEIELKYNSSSEKIQLSVYNVFGQKCFQMNRDNNTVGNIHLDISDLRQGIYFIRLVENGNIFQCKFIKQ
jgi:hypothetical protein